MMHPILDLRPATRQMAKLLEGVTEDQLTATTPCDEYTRRPVLRCSEN